jgi:hypothetical protein
VILPQPPGPVDRPAVFLPAAIEPVPAITIAPVPPVAA